MSEEPTQLPEDKSPVTEHKQKVVPELVPGADPELVLESAPAAVREVTPALVPELSSALLPDVAPEALPEALPGAAPASLTESHKNESTGKTIKWNQNKKIPRIYPGIILSLILTILMSITIFQANVVLGSAAAFLILLVTIYWTFCVFRLTGQLQYKSKGRKITDRILALLIPLLSNPGVMVVFLGMALAMSAMIVAAGFHFKQDYALNHSGLMVTYMTVNHLLLSIALVYLPIVAIPTICMGWTYKFMVKVASVNEPTEKSTFWKTRGPAILVLVNNFICVEGWLFGLLSVPSANDYCIAFAFLGFFTCGLCQAINFFILWRCVRKKEALSVIT